MLGCQMSVYVIISPHTDDVYIGCTFQPIETRLQQHRCHFCMYVRDEFAYCTSFEVVQYIDVSIGLLEQTGATTRVELNQYERKWRQKVKNCVNKAY